MLGWDARNPFSIFLQAESSFGYLLLMQGLKWQKTSSMGFGKLGGSTGAPAEDGEDATNGDQQRAGRFRNRNNRSA